MNSIKFISRNVSYSSKEGFKISHNFINYMRCIFFSSLPNEFQNLSEEDDFLNKVIYNEVFQELPKVKPKVSGSICLKFLSQEKTQKNEIKTKNVETTKEIVHFPYKTKHQNDEKNLAEESFSESVKNFTAADFGKIEVPQWKSENYQLSFRSIENPHKWIYEDIKVQKEYELDDAFKFGSCNPDSPISSVPCGGCGALLQCNNSTLPGFIPAELFEGRNKNDLLGEKCQRCHFLKEFGIALGVNVAASEYKNLISSIKDKNALAIIMIDILDFPCSVFPEIIDLIGSTKPIVIVANKVDLLIQEEPQCEETFKKSLVWSLRKQKINLENVKHVALISAKTGYGIEKLIDVLFSLWKNKGDIYLVGCTNVGKSSLFNTLIQSDFCKVKAINLLQRATVSAWPGTTLNLLKFPIMRPNEWRLLIRSKRLSLQLKEESAFKKFQCLGQNINLEQIPLQEYVGKTQFNKEDPSNLIQSDNSSSDIKRKGINPYLQDFAKGYWFYDTPGVVNQDQIVNLLTAAELLLTVPKKMLLPRNFYMKPGTSLFIAGLARLDFIEGPDFAWFTVYASMELPLTVTKIEDAEYIYQKFLGTPYFRVPVKGKERLAKWPGLMSKKLRIEGKFVKVLSKNYKLKGKKLPKDTDVDVVLSSAGWISVTVPPGYYCKLEAWTPQGRGIHLRDLPVIKKGYTFRGPKIPGTPAFKTVMKEAEGHLFTDPPKFLL